MVVQVGPMSENLTGAVGNTPLVKLNSITKDLDATIAVKLEYVNPTASVKDRAASNIIAEAEKNGEIVPGKSVLIEGTSGNTGIALAAIARAKGYKCVIVMPSAASIERRATLRAFGALVVLTNPEEGFVGVEARVRALAEMIPNSYYTNQFGNPANWQAHYKGTGPEIWQQTDGKVDAVVFGIGTGGTVTGVGKFLREKKAEVQVYGVEPYESSILNGLPKGVHKIQGIGAGVVPEVLDQSIMDGVLRVKSDDAIEMALRLAQEEGIMAGISSGANVCAALELAKRPENKGKTIVTTVNSFGERYLSSALYEEMRDACGKLNHETLEESQVQVKKYMELA